MRGEGGRGVPRLDGGLDGEPLFIGREDLREPWAQLQEQVLRELDGLIGVPEVRQGLLREMRERLVEGCLVELGPEGEEGLQLQRVLDDVVGRVVRLDADVLELPDEKLDGDAEQVSVGDLLLLDFVREALVLLLFEVVGDGRREGFRLLDDVLFWCQVWHRAGIALKECE